MPHSSVALMMPTWWFLQRQRQLLGAVMPLRSFLRAASGRSAKIVNLRW
jgi:hypothetical protein